MRLTVLIATHNRAPMLARALAALRCAKQPPGVEVHVLVVANACSDETTTMVERIARESWDPRMGLMCIDEPVAGKSRAINRAIPLLEPGLVAMIDDDQRVAADFLEQIVAAFATYPDATMVCGRLLPDWDGQEPSWVHDCGPYRIYPPPITTFDPGPAPVAVSEQGPLTSGGNLIVERGVFERCGGFSTALGPSGHNLEGGEDSEFVLRCLRAGERMWYVPQILQFHYVDPERLRIGHILRMAFRRSRSSLRASGKAGQGIPRYIWLKLARYVAACALSLRAAQRRFYLVRVAATLGELSALAQRH